MADVSTSIGNGVGEVEEVDLVRRCLIRGWIYFGVRPVPVVDRRPGCLSRIGQSINIWNAASIQLRMPDIQLHGWLRGGIDVVLIDTATVGGRPEHPPRRMQLQVEDRRVRQAIREGRPGRAAVCRTPYSDIGTRIQVRWVARIADEGVVLNVHEGVERTRGRATARCPCRTVEVPDAAKVSAAPESDVERVASRICRINRHAGYRLRGQRWGMEMR